MKFTSQNKRSVLIIIPNARELSFLRDTVESIKENTKGIDYNFCIVLNSDYEENKQYFIDNNLFHINNEYNAGYPNAVNRAFRIAQELRFPYSFVMSDDITVKSGKYDWLSDLVSVMESDTSVGMVSPKKWNVANFPEFGVSYVEQVASAAILVRMQTVYEVGGFDEKFPFSYHDSDYCIMMNTYGWKVKVTDVDYFEYTFRGGKDILSNYMDADKVPEFMSQSGRSNLSYGYFKMKQLIKNILDNMEMSERVKLWDK